MLPLGASDSGGLFLEESRINHSCQPNAVLRIRQGRVEFYAMRDVRMGEELTVNYGETHHEGKLACRCGAPGCVGRL